MRVSLVGTLSYSGTKGRTVPIFLEDFYFPLGLLSLAAVLERAGNQVEVIDPDWEAYEHALPYDVTLYNHVVENVLAGKPDWVGFTTMCDSYHHSIALAEQLRSRSSVPIVFGGPQATAVAEKTLERFRAIDMILRGESEATVESLLGALAGAIPCSGVPGLTYRDIRGGIQAVPTAPLIADLDTLPIPSFSHYAKLAGKVNYLSVEAGRGCPFRCKFCSTSLFWERKYRLKSGERIAGEMFALERIFGDGCTYRLIHDMLTVDRRLVNRMCTVLAQMNPPRKWTCSARADCVNAELLASMARSGCTSIYFGIESGSQSLQRKMQKNLRLNRVMPVIDAACAGGMEVTLSFIAGYPDETMDELNETLHMVFDAVRQHGSAIKVQMHILAPYVGTELYAASRDRLQFDGYFSDQTGQPIRETDGSMIRQCPELFSNFFYVPNEHYARETLFGLDSFIYVILKDYPLTLQLLLRRCESPLQLYLNWQRHALALAQAPQLAFVNADRTMLHASLASLVKECLSRLPPQTATFISEVKRYEDMFTTSSSESESVGVPGESPLLPANLQMRAVTFAVSVEDVVAALREGRALPESNPGVMHHYVVARMPDLHLRVLAVTPFVARMVEKCDGTGNIDDLAQALHRDYPGETADAVRTACLYSMNTLTALGVMAERGGSHQCSAIAGETGGDDHACMHHHSAVVHSP